MLGAEMAADATTTTPAPVPAVETPLPADAGAWLERVGAHLDESGRALVARALETAVRAHAGQRRASGEPYVRHTMAVAEILAGLRLDAEALAAALLHDVVEDTPLTLEELRAAFGGTVARLVDGVTKLGALPALKETLDEAQRRDADQAENLRKLLLAMAEDVRVVLIKLADRLHNMRTLDALPEGKRRRIARETLEIYAPLANRLGIAQIKWELEDLAFRHLEPQAYREIAALLERRRSEREAYVARAIAELERALARAGIRARITGRPKHIYSIWRKMRRKGVGFEQVFDVHAVRVLVDDVTACYAALGVVHSLWPPIPGEFDDYIAQPKENLYQSLHTAVVALEGRTLEVQIRTHEMHRYAEYGVAAHWRYKEGVRSDPALERKIAWLRQLLEPREGEGGGDFLERFKSEVYQERVYVLTPKGQVVDLPAGATPLDFAYYIHTDVGHRCRGARVNGRIVPLTYELRSGDQVEVLTTRQGGPSRDWLNPELGYLRTSRARAKVRHWFRQQDHERNVAGGREVLERELRRLGMADLPWERLAERLGQRGVEEMLAAIGRGDLTPAQIAGAAQQLAGTPAPAAAPGARRRRDAAGAEAVRVQGVGNLLTQLARCCRPAPGDAIVGYLTQGRGVSVHRRDCANILRLPPGRRDRLIEVEWADGSDSAFPVEIVVEAWDRHGLLRDVAGVFAAERINLRHVATRTDAASGIARLDLTAEVRDIAQLARVLARVAQLPNVIDARRRGGAHGAPGRPH